MKFKPEDFDGLTGINNGGRRMAALRANRKLRKWLAEAPTVYSGYVAQMLEAKNLSPMPSTHIAKLVIIKEIGK